MAKTVTKTVRVESYPLPAWNKYEIEHLLFQTQKCLNSFYSRFSGIRSLEKIQDAKKLRDELRIEQANKHYSLADIYHFQSRHWVMALFQCCSNLKSVWSNTANRVKKLIMRNDNLTDDEKKYCTYIVSAPHYWYCILNQKLIVNNQKLDSFNINSNRLSYLSNVIRRTTRYCKSKIPRVKDLNCLLLDENMYKIYEENNKTFLKITGVDRYLSITVELKSPYHYNKKGNIQVIYDRDKNVIRIHKAIKTKVKKGKRKGSLGIDKGHATLLSCSNGHEYGYKFGELQNKQDNYINANIIYKNKLRDYRKHLIESINTMSDSQKEVINKKIKNLDKCNLGKQKFNRNCIKYKARTEQIINRSIKQMIADTNASIFAVEDLTFTTSKNKNRSKIFNRHMNFWNKGVIDARIEYISSFHNIKVTKVNAAYTSQFCATCSSKLTGRKGKHSEIGVCPNCGEMDANINAAKNIQSRLKDTEITTYTKYKTVESILLNRFKQKSISSLTK